MTIHVSSPAGLRGPLALGVIASALLWLASGAVSAGDIQPAADIARAASAEALRLSAGAAAVTVREARVDPRLRLPRCADPLMARASPGNRAGGRLTVEVRCQEPAWHVYVPVTLSARAQVVVAARPLPAHTSLATGDVILAERDLHGLPSGYFRRIEDLRGLEVTRALGAGEVVSPAQVRAGALVRRGQEVILVAQTDTVAVRMKGEVLADGGLNQRVRVRNLSSGREVEGVVRSADLVEVPL